VPSKQRVSTPQPPTPSTESSIGVLSPRWTVRKRWRRFIGLMCPKNATNIVPLQQRLLDGRVLGHQELRLHRSSASWEDEHRCPKYSVGAHEAASSVNGSRHAHVVSTHRHDRLITATMAPDRWGLPTLRIHDRAGVAIRLRTSRRLCQRLDLVGGRHRRAKLVRIHLCEGGAEQQHLGRVVNP